MKRFKKFYMLLSILCILILGTPIFLPPLTVQAAPEFSTNATQVSKEVTMNVDSYYEISVPAQIILRSQQDCAIPMTDTDGSSYQCTYTVMDMDKLEPKNSANLYFANEYVEIQGVSPHNLLLKFAAPSMYAQTADTHAPTYIMPYSSDDLLDIANVAIMEKCMGHTSNTLREMLTWYNSLADISEEEYAAIDAKTQVIYDRLHLINDGGPDPEHYLLPMCPNTFTSSSNRICYTVNFDRKHTVGFAIYADLPYADTYTGNLTIDFSLTDEEKMYETS